MNLIYTYTKKAFIYVIREKSNLIVENKIVFKQ